MRKAKYGEVKQLAQGDIVSSRLGTQLRDSDFSTTSATTEAYCLCLPKQRCSLHGYEIPNTGNSHNQRLVK